MHKERIWEIKWLLQQYNGHKTFKTIVQGTLTIPQSTAELEENKLQHLGFKFLVPFTRRKPKNFYD